MLVQTLDSNSTSRPDQPLLQKKRGVTAKTNGCASYITNELIIQQKGARENTTEGVQAFRRTGAVSKNIDPPPNTNKFKNHSSRMRLRAATQKAPRETRKREVIGLERRRRNYLSVQRPVADALARRPRRPALAGSPSLSPW